MGEFVPAEGAGAVAPQPGGDAGPAEGVLAGLCLQRVLQHLRADWAKAVRGDRVHKEIGIHSHFKDLELGQGHSLTCSFTIDNIHYIWFHIRKSPLNKL